MIGAIDSLPRGDCPPMTHSGHVPRVRPNVEQTMGTAVMAQRHLSWVDSYLKALEQLGGHGI